MPIEQNIAPSLTRIFRCVAILAAASSLIISIAVTYLDPNILIASQNSLVFKLPLFKNVVIFLASLSLLIYIYKRSNALILTCSAIILTIGIIGIAQRLSGLPSHSYLLISLAGIGLLLIGLPNIQKSHVTILGILASLIMSLSVIILYGSMVQENNIVLWQDLSTTNALQVIAFFMIGISFLSFDGVRNLTIPSNLFHWAYAPGIALGITATLCLGLSIDAKDGNHIRELMNVESKGIETRIYRHLNSQIYAMRRMAKRLELYVTHENNPQLADALWVKDVSVYLKDFTTFLAIAKTDSDMVIRNIVPENDIRLKEIFFRSNLNNPDFKHDIQIQPLSKYIPQMNGFIIGAPYLSNNQFGGFILSIVDYNHWFESIAMEVLDPYLDMRIYVNDVLTFTTSPDIPEFPKYVQPITVDQYNQKWRIELIPRDEWVESVGSGIAIFVIISGIIFTVLLAYASKQAYIANLRAREISIENHKRSRAEQHLTELTKNLELRIKERTQALASQQRAAFNIMEDTMKAKEDMEFANSRLSGIIEGTHDLIAAVDTQYRLIAFNSAYANSFERLFGKKITLSQSILENLSHLPEQRERQINSWNRALNGELFTEIESYPDPVLNQTYYYETNYSQIRDPQGEIIGASHIIRNITEMKNAEQDLRSTAESLARSNRELEQFAYVASHDLQEPLRMVASYAQLLFRRYNNVIDASAQDFINYIVEGAKRMQELINDLLLFSRIDVKENTMEAVDISETVAKVTTNLSHIIESTNAKILTNELPQVLGNHTQIYQLFQNIIGNALKYRSDQNPLVNIEAKKEGKMWSFLISDNGIGFEQEYAHRIFELFQRLESRKKYDGTGIGLAICKKIVEQSGGRIWADSKVGVGTNFHFTLPSA